jgi:hypothetical protein
MLIHGRLMLTHSDDLRREPDFSRPCRAVTARADARCKQNSVTLPKKCKKYH